jgi:hypothetical protein
MPYYDPRKLSVNGWFSATKRSLSDCASEEALEQLKNDYGLTVLYQYLHRYANPESCRLNDKFVQSVNRISSDGTIFVGTVSTIMKRLRQLQAVFILCQGKTIWFINSGDEDIDNLQIVADRPFDIEQHDGSIMRLGCTHVIKTLPRNTLRCIRTSDRVVLSHTNLFSVGESRRLSYALPFGELLINLDVNEWQTTGSASLRPDTFRLKTLHSGTGIPILSSLPYKEELGLLTDQTELIARELLLGRRSLNTEKYLDSSRRIPLEDHENW